MPSLLNSIHTPLGALGEAFPSFLLWPHCLRLDGSPGFGSEKKGWPPTPVLENANSSRDKQNMAHISAQVAQIQYTPPVGIKAVRVTQCLAGHFQSYDGEAQVL
jgi:hypothetical protein